MSRPKDLQQGIPLWQDDDFSLSLRLLFVVRSITACVRSNRAQRRRNSEYGQGPFVLLTLQSGSLFKDGHSCRWLPSFLRAVLLQHSLTQRKNTVRVEIRQTDKTRKGMKDDEKHCADRDCWDMIAIRRKEMSKHSGDWKFHVSQFFSRC